MTLWLFLFAVVLTVFAWLVVEIFFGVNEMNDGFQELREKLQREMDERMGRGLVGPSAPLLPGHLIDAHLTVIGRNKDHLAGTTNWAYAMHRELARMLKGGTA